MRRIEYKVNLDGEPFTVASCDMERPYSNPANYPLPITMRVIRCCSRTTKHVSITTMLSLEDISAEGIAAGFGKECVNALACRSKKWILAQFQVCAESVKLQYYNPTTDDIEDITLCVDGNPVNLLDLEFKVPHQDSRPDTEYHVHFNHHRLGKNEPLFNDVSIMERLPSSHRRTLFLLDSREPNEMSVVENVDL